MQSQLVCFFNFFFVSLIYIYFTLLFFLNLSIVIDPRFKLSYYRKQEWEQHYIEAAKKIFISTFKDFYQNNNAINDIQNNDESDFFLSIFVDNNNNNNSEVEAYLQQPVAPVKTDPLLWWKVNCMNVFL